MRSNHADNEHKKYECDNYILTTSQDQQIFEQIILLCNIHILFHKMILILNNARLHKTLKNTQHVQKVIYHKMNTIQTF